MNDSISAQHINNYSNNDKKLANKSTKLFVSLQITKSVSQKPIYVYFSSKKWFTHLECPLVVVTNLIFTKITFKSHLSIRCTSLPNYAQKYAICTSKTTVIDDKNLLLLPIITSYLFLRLIVFALSSKSIEQYGGRLPIRRLQVPKFPLLQVSSVQKHLQQLPMTESLFSVKYLRLLCT